MDHGVMIFVQQVDGVAAKVSLELIGKGKDLAAELGCHVTAVVLGSNLEKLTREMGEFGADSVIAADDTRLGVYMNEPYTQVICDIINEYKPQIMLFGATAIGRDLAPRVSARVHTGLTADCTKLEIADSQLMMTRPAFGGNIMATISCPEHRPQMATVRPGVMEQRHRESGRQAEVINFPVKLTDDAVNVEILDIVKSVSDLKDIQDAKIIVSGGRGIGGPESFKLLEDVAARLGGMVGASRAAVDAGWIGKEHQVGQTGKTVRPAVYIACGISGAIQHIAGMEHADLIIAINKDETAPIFQVADYGIVGDVLKVLPMLSDLLEKEGILAN